MLYLPTDTPRSELRMDITVVHSGFRRQYHVYYSISLGPLRHFFLTYHQMVTR
jgi:hypothetical protein